MTLVFAPFDGKNRGLPQRSAREKPQTQLILAIIFENKTKTNQKLDSHHNIN